MEIEQIKLTSVFYRAEELRVLSEDEDVHVIYHLSMTKCEVYGVREYDRYRVRPLKWWIRNKSDEDLERLASNIELGAIALVRFK